MSENPSFALWMTFAPCVCRGQGGGGGCSILIITFYSPSPPPPHLHCIKLMKSCAIKVDIIVIIMTWLGFPVFQYNNPPDRQVEELLDLLPKRGPNAFKLFCDSLVATDQQDVVTNILQKKDGVETSSSSSSLAAASVPASPLPDAVAETADVSLSGGVPVASASSSAPALGSSPLPASVQASSLSASDPSSLDPLLTSSPTTPHKRKPMKSAREASENDDKSHLASPSETDSSSVKRLCTDSGSVICIRGDNENVIKIYSPQADKKGNHSQNKHIFESGNPQRSFAIPKLLPGSEATADQGACRTDEIRYVMKHFIQNERDEDRQHSENIRLAKSMLSDIPQEYLKLLSPNQSSLTKMTRDEDFSHDLLRERLSRCDSTGKIYVQYVFWSAVMWYNIYIYNVQPHI